VKLIGIAASVLCLAIAAVLVSLLAGSGPEQHAHARIAPARAGSAAQSQPGPLPAQLPSDRGQLAADINRAQDIIDDPASPNPDMASAGLFEELATGALARDTPQGRRATLAMLSGRAAAGMRANLDASASLSRLSTPRARFPPWRIVQPPAPSILLGFYRVAQSRYGIGWEYLAAIELVETRFGRIRGPSSAGAQGPMQFLPATWAAYGSGNIDNQRDAILAAARYLAANGGPDNMANALYHYNNSPDYVTAVRDYATRMRADPRAYAGYYNWQVIYARARGGAFILPVGYPTVRPVPLRSR
jgi:membrane-bound lytic murein transglycosylase B